MAINFCDSAVPIVTNPNRLLSRLRSPPATGILEEQTDLYDAVNFEITSLFNYELKKDYSIYIY